MSDAPTGHIRYYEGASLIEIVSHYTEFPRKHTGGGKRGKVGGFSDAARKRMMCVLNKLKEEDLRKALLITLTYRRNEITGKELRSNFKAFRECLRRAYPSVSGIWKLEYQRRGSPHYHLLVFGGFIPHTWIARNWNRIAEDGDPLHLAAGTRIETCRHACSTGRYLTKYLGKINEEGDNNAEGSFRINGRHWGYINRDCLPFGEAKVVPLRGSRAREIIRFECARRSLGPQGDSVNGISVFTRDARHIHETLEEYRNLEL